jgi:hypothetical protein
MERINPFIPNKGFYRPDDIRDLYVFQESRYRIPQIGSMSEFLERKNEFLASPLGKEFQNCKIRQFSELFGVNLFFVDDEKINRGGKAGDIDFVMGGHGFRYLYVPQSEIWISIKFRGNLQPIIWHEFTERSLMAGAMSYNDSHDKASQIEMVHREGKLFVLPVGTYRISRPGLCCPGALKIYMDYLSMATLRPEISEDEITIACAADPEIGSTPEEMMTGAEKLGFKPHEYQNFTVEEVKKFIRSGYPVIANYQQDREVGSGHYAVICGFSENEFLISDPSEDEGYVFTPINQFMEMWYELEDKTVKQGIILDINKTS